jgi:hypothetical protein
MFCTMLLLVVYQHLKNVKPAIVISLPISLLCLTWYCAIILCFQVKYV